MALKRYPALDRCLYCLATGMKRTEEHLIPRSLGGRLTLRDAVCDPCRIATGRLEQATLEREFVVPRTLLALKRRRARGKGPERLAPVRLEDAPADAAPVELAACDYPRTFTLPTFERAGLLANEDRSAAPPRVDFVRCRLQLGAPGRAHAAATQALADPHAYGYSIAKWAYALAVAERGLHGFDTHAIRQLLTGRRDDVFNFVGTPRSPVPAPRDRLHTVALRDDAGTLVVDLGLLASAGMTPYEVAIGAL
jgi:hypothetical protein